MVPWNHKFEGSMTLNAPLYTFFSYLLYSQDIFNSFPIIAHWKLLFLSHSKAILKLSQTTVTVEQIISSFNVALCFKLRIAINMKKTKKDNWIHIWDKYWEQGLCLSHEYCSTLVGPLTYWLWLWWPEFSSIPEVSASTSISE